MDYLLIFEKFGVPIAMLFMISIAIWRIIVWTGNKVLLPLVYKHIELIDTVQKALKDKT